MSRKSISKRVRFEVFKRDGFTCVYCGRKPPEVILHLDHLVAVSKGGGNEDVNLVTSCADCNGGKSNQAINQLPLTHVVSLEKSREKLEQMRELAKAVVEQKSLENQYLEIISDLWMQLQGDDPDEYKLPPSQESAVRKFIAFLPLDELIDAVHVTFDKKGYGHLRYFCGVCWKKISNRKEAADKKRNLTINHYELDTIKQRSN